MTPTSRRRLLATVFFPLVLLGVGELSLRIVGFSRPLHVPMVVWNRLEDRELDGGNGLHRFSARQLWEPRPGAAIPWGEGETINGEGYRGPSLERLRDPAVLRIALLGESSTFGMNVAWRNTFGAQLTRELEKKGVRAEVLDAGVIGHTVEQGIERYRELVREYDPDVVVIAFGAYNEHLPAPDLEDREKIAERSRWSDFWPGLLSRMHSSSRLVQWVSSLGAAAGDDALGDAKRAFWELHGGHGKVGWRGKRRVSLQRFEESLERLISLVRQDGARVVLIAMARDPGKEEESPVLREYDAIIHRVGADSGVDVLDARERMLALLSAKVPFDDLLVDAFHPAPPGHRLIALGLTELLAPATD